MVSSASSTSGSETSSQDTEDTTTSSASTVSTTSDESEETEETTSSENSESSSDSESSEASEATATTQQTTTTEDTASTKSSRSAPAKPAVVGKPGVAGNRQAKRVIPQEESSESEEESISSDSSESVPPSGDRKAEEPVKTVTIAPDAILHQESYGPDIRTDAQQVARYYTKYRAKSVREMVADQTGEQITFDETWRTSVAIEGMQVESMARKRWKWAVTQILEQQAAAKQAQLQWREITEIAKKKKFRARGVHLGLFLLGVLEMILMIIFLLVPDIRRDGGVYDSDQIQLIVSMQLFIGALVFVTIVYVSVALFEILRKDPKLRHTPTSSLVLFKCCDLVGYVCQMGYPTTQRAGFLGILFTLASFQVLTFFYVMWKYQYATLLKQPANMPTVLRALLSLKQNTPAYESPMTVGLVESLLHWLSRNKTKKIILPGGVNIQYLGLFLVALIISMATTSILTMTSFHAQLLPNQTLQRMAAESDPLNSTVLGVPSFWESTGRFLNSEDGHPRRVLLLIASGIRFDAFEDGLRFLSSRTQANSVLFKMNTQTPAVALPNWLSLISGVKPETSGYLGNVIPKVSDYDTLFHRCAGMDLKRGIASSPWLSAFVQPALEAFVGTSYIGPDYTLDESFAQPVDVLKFDDRRHNAVLEAISDGIPFDFFVSQFMHATSVANSDGLPTDIFTTSNSYLESVAHIMNRIDEIVSRVVDNTVVMVVSDHGHIPGPFGGSGGIDPAAVEVPLFVYKNNWDDVPTPAADLVVDSINVAPTVSMILGIPTPRHNQGKFIDELSTLVPSNANLLRNWEDLLVQSTVFAKTHIQLLSGNGKQYDTELEKYLIAARENPTLENYIAQYNGLREFTEAQRTDYSNTVSTRNVGVTFVFAILVLGFEIFMMQVLTMSDPFVLFSLSVFKSPKKHFKNTDVRAFIQAIFLTVIHYGLTFVMFRIGCVMFGYSVIDPTLVQSSRLVSLYLVGCLVTSFVSAYSLQRVQILMYHQFDNYRVDSKFANKWNLFLNRVNLYLFRPLAFKDFEMAYLSRMYGMMVATFFALLFILAKSRFVFIIPFVFTNQFLDESTWGLRFTTLTLLLITIPLLMLRVWGIVEWSSQKLNAESYHAFEERRQTKEMRMKLLTGTPMTSAPESETQYKSKALQAGSKYAGIATRRRPHIGPEMFDALEDEIAENKAEVNVLRRQITEMDLRIAALIQEEKATRERLQTSNEGVSNSLEEIYAEMKRTIPGDQLPANEYDEIRRQAVEFENNLKKVEGMVLEHIKLRKHDIDKGDIEPELATAFESLFGEDFSLRMLEIDSRPEMAAHEKFIELTHKHQRDEQELEKLKARILFYENHFRSVKVRRTEELAQLNTVFDAIIKENSKLKNQIVGMIEERNNLLQTLKNLKTRRNEANQLYKTEMFHMESKEEHLKEEYALLSEEFELIEQEKEVLFQEITKVAAQLHAERLQLKKARAEVEQYRKMLTQMME